nr:MAG TPA: hypothetical protein [Caudoviricetes sp.]
MCCRQGHKSGEKRRVPTSRLSHALWFSRLPTAVPSSVQLTYHKKKTKN